MQQISRYREQQWYQNNREAERLGRSGDGDRGSDRGEAGSGEAARAVEPVQGGEDRAAIAVLDQHRLRIHRHVQHAVGRPEEQQRQDQREEVWRHYRHRQQQAKRQPGRPGRRIAAEPPGRPPGPGQHQHRTDRHRKERNAEQKITEPEPLLDLGNMRQPTRHDEAVCEEHERRRGSGTPQSGSRRSFTG